MINDFPHVNDSKSVKLQGPARANRVQSLRTGCDRQLL